MPPTPCAGYLDCLSLNSLFYVKVYLYGKAVRAAQIKDHPFIRGNTWNIFEKTLANYV